MNNGHNKPIAALSLLCWLYTGLSVFFYILPSIAFGFPILACIGAHAPYYLLLLTMLLQEHFSAIGDPIIAAFFIVMVCSYVAAYIVTFIMACRKKFLPFGILSIVGSAIGYITVLTAIILNGQNMAFHLFYLFSLIGNTVFCIVYMLKIPQMLK